MREMKVWMPKTRYLEEIKDGTGVQTGLLVDRSQSSAFCASVSGKSGVQVELQALCKVVLSLEGGADEVCSGPSLGEGDTVGLVGVLCLDVSIDDLGLVVVLSSDLERDVVGGGGLDLELDVTEGVVTVQQVVGGLAEILQRRVVVSFCTLETAEDDEQLTFQDGGTG